MQYQCMYVNFCINSLNRTFHLRNELHVLPCSAFSWSTMDIHQQLNTLVKDQTIKITEMGIRIKVMSYLKT